MKLQLIKARSNQLKPANPEAERYLQKVPYNEQVSVEIRRPRNPQFHKKFFAMLQMVYDNQETYTTFDAFRDEVVMRAGFWEQHVHLTGNVSYKAKSLAYEAMDEGEFADLFDKCAEVLMEYFLPDTKRHALEEAILDFITDYAA